MSTLIQINIIQGNKIKLLILMKLFVMDLLIILKNNLKEFKKNMLILKYLMKIILHKIIRYNLKSKFQFKLLIYL